MIYQTHILSNGIKIIHQEINTNVAHCGLIINAGSRDEEKDEHGLAHFIEHLLFKGTKKRRAYHIVNRLESVGGEINAYTTKEETCIYTAFLKDDYERSLELISDITFNSNFPKKEIEKEKVIIYDEINSYKDSPVDLIFDEFEEMVYKEAAIGRNILGNKRKLKQFNKNHIINFINNNYHTDQMVLSSVGNINLRKLIKSVEKYFGHIQPNYRHTIRNGKYEYTPFQKRVKKRTYQAHCVIGNLAYDIKDNRRIGLGLLNNVLGGPGSNSRLNYSLREKNGFAYDVESHYVPYSDTGILTIYFGADKENINKSIKLINKEIDKLINVKLTANQLKIAKRQLTGQMAIYSDNHENLMISNGKNYNIFNQIITYEEMKEKIYSITGEELQEIANEILNKDKLSTLIYE